jgi:probable F420-dependent oxidoreductase
MKFAIAFANTGPFCDAEGAVRFAQAAEAAGFESLWTVEHVVVPADYQSEYPYSESGKMPGRDDFPIPDPLIWLAYLASATSKIRLATGILILAQRQPVVVAKELATLDALSGGRMELGVGVGWLREEFDALGISFEDRGRRTDEYIAALRTLWTEKEASFSGEFTSFSRCISEPKPVRGTIPVHIGGHSEIAARRAGRLGDGFFPVEGDHASLRRLFEVARASAEESGRSADDLILTTSGRGAVGERALDEVGALAEMGVQRVIVPAFMFFKDTDNALARYGEEVIAKSAN